MGLEALDAETVQKFADATERTILLHERLGMYPVTGVGNATISVNAGGLGVWISATSCFVVLAVVLMGAFWVSREFTRVDSYISDLKNTNDIQDAYITKLRAEQQKERP